MNWRPHWTWFVILICLGGSATAHAQLDPEKRRLFQFGYNQPLQGRGPLAGYAYYYYNQPEFIQTNLTLRLAIAPVYVDSELGIRNALSPNTDLAIGLAGGGFADSYWEIRGGNYLREESFTGHGAEAGVSLYHRFNPDQQIPLNVILRGFAHYTFYETDNHTAPGFMLPPDHATLHVRTGLRWGGREPLMLPTLAMELSAWYDGQYRAEEGPYGFNGDRELRANSHLFWARALLAYTLPELKHYFSVSLTAGTSLKTDRLSAYRIGGALPLVSEFPLTLPGYYFQELTADRFALFSGQYALPLDRSKRLGLMLSAATAVVDYLPGLEQPGQWNSGVGAGVVFRSKSEAWQVMLGYAYGIDAIRNSGRGAHSVGILIQYDLEADRRGKRPFWDPWLNPSKWRGFDWLFGR